MKLAILMFGAEIGLIENRWQIWAARNVRARGKYFYTSWPCQCVILNCKATNHFGGTKSVFECPDFEGRSPYLRRKTQGQVQVLVQHPQFQLQVIGKGDLVRTLFSYFGARTCWLDWLGGQYAGPRPRWSLSFVRRIRWFPPRRPRPTECLISV